MSQEIRTLEPAGVWNNFTNINAIPRASKKEDEIVAYMVSFGKKLGLETIVDDVQNVLIKKPATAGMESRKTIVMQSHLDMVHQKNNETIFDFDTQGIDMFVEGDWVKAKGTTLGADNGLGVASIMAILESNTIEHPAIEALFTIDEETGMTGAMELQPEFLTGEILLNLDTEDDDEIGVGCAGGVDVTATKSYIPVQVDKHEGYIKISVKGLQGGHSGMDIIKGLGNANKLMNRIMTAVQDTMQINQIDGGGLRNAIPRESNAVVIITDANKFKNQFEEIKAALENEYASLEPDMEISYEEIASVAPLNALGLKDQNTILNTLYGLHNGVYRMSPDIKDLVETSNNVARVEIKDGSIKVLCLTRSSVESGKWDMANGLKAVFDLGGFNVTFSGSYPGWQPNPNSAILKVMKSLYTNLFNEEPNVLACHAGLECGLLGTHYPEMDMISFGPTIKGAHSPDERASISSTKKYWTYLLEILKNIPEQV
ncbi:aminoacyl-histidine dipeptidase [Urechidicola sp. KH5]